MNHALILKLSLFGLAMGLATVFVIPSNLEPLFWLAIFAVSAVILAKAHVKGLFLHGVLTSLANCVWITGAHILFSQTYIQNHPQEAAIIAKMPLPDSPRLMMLVTGPVVGVISGVVLGLFAVVAGKVLASRVTK